MDFFTVAELKDGLTVTSRVQELVSVMQSNKDSVLKNDTRQWAAVASTIAATKNRECLDVFVNLDGLRYFGSWLAEAQLLASVDKSVEESILALLEALENLGVDGSRLVSSGLWVSVKKLVDHGSSRVQDQARKLFASWKDHSERDTESCSKAHEDEMRVVAVSMESSELKSGVTLCSTQSSNEKQCPEIADGALLSGSSGQNKPDQDKVLETSNNKVESDSMKEVQENLYLKENGSMVEAVAVSSSSAGHLAVSPGSVIATTELEKNSLLQSSLDSKEVGRNACKTICGSIALNSKHLSSLAHVMDDQDSDNSSGGHGRNTKVESDTMTVHAENEDTKDDKGQLDKKKRVKRRKSHRSSRSMTISQRLGAIDKTTADIDLGILDALEVATKVAQEVAREVDSGEASHSSSEDESGQSDSQDSHHDDLHKGSPSKGLSMGESHSLVGDDDVMDEKNNKRENGMMNSDEVEEKHQPAAAKFEVGREKSPCGFDLNEDICPDEIDVVMSTSHSGMPAASPLQLERSLSGKRSVSSSVSHSELPHNVPSGDSGDKRVICIDLNVAEVGGDQVEDQTPWKQFPFSSSKTRGGESSPEAKLQGSSRFGLDLNFTNEDDDMPPPSDLKMETRLFLSHNGQQSASPVSSLSVSQQSGKEVNFDLNNRPQGPYYGQHPWSTAPYGGHRLAEPVISIMGTKVDVVRKETVPQMASFSSNGKSLEPAAGLFMGSSLGLGSGVSFSPAPMYGYNGFTGPPGMSMSSSPMYVPGTAIPYMVDARGTPVMMPQIMGSAPYAQPPFPQQHMFMSLAGGSTSLNGSRCDQSSGFGVEMGNRESLSLRQFLSPGDMGEHSGTNNIEPSSSLSISIGGKRKEPETRWEFPPPWR